MADRVPGLCNALAQAFRDGRLDGIGRYYNSSLAIYAPQGVRPEVDANSTAKALFRRRVTAVKAGMADIRVSVHEERELGRDRLSVRLSRNFFDLEGARIARSRIRDHCRRMPEGARRVELIEFEERAFASVFWPKQAPEPRN